jgi:hypothetical protein
VSATVEEARAELNARCDAIEACYEYMLAYAAQGLAAEPGSGSSSQIREFLSKCDGALTGLADFIVGFATQLQLAPLSPYRAFAEVLGRDARDAQAAIRLAIAQPSIGSQLVDNLNASIHLRALLTDLFLIDEILKTHRRAQ